MAPPAIEDKILVFVTATDAANIEQRGESLYFLWQRQVPGG